MMDSQEKKLNQVNPEENLVEAPLANAETTPAEDAAVVEETPAAEEAPAVEEAPVVEETPVAEETSAEEKE